MKAFEEWSNRTYYEWDALCSTDKMKVTWKAALEWALNRSKVTSWSKQEIEEYKEFCNKRRFLKRIEEELKNESI